MFEARLSDEKNGLPVQSSQVHIMDFDPALVRSWVETHGAVLFHCSALDVSSFIKFTEQFLARAAIHGEPSRRQITGDGTLLEVSPGNGSISLHSELALTPNRPDLLWFYCVEPATSGGETIICDGIRAYNALTPETRTLFTTNKLRYVTRIMPGTLKRHFPELEHEQAVRHLASIQREGTEVKLTSDGGELHYVSSAVVRTRWGGQLAFANSISGPYASSRKWVGFDGIGPIPGPVMAEIGTVTTKEAIVVKLQAGDVIMIDNSRFMHGRRSFTGPRSLYVRMGSANW